MGIVDLIYPKVCVGCGIEGKYICDKCRQGVPRAGESLRYIGLVRKIIKEIKYRGTYDMVRELVEVWNPVWQAKYEGAIVTSVPMWNHKKRERGYNQAELIARELAKKWGLEYADTLERIRETRPMYGLSKSERKENVGGAFVVSKKLNAKSFKLAGLKVLLVDDVWTTGATMGECAKVLKSTRVKEVWAMTLAC